MAASRRGKGRRGVVAAEGRATSAAPVLDERAVARISRALADRNRFQILREIAAERELSCGAIADRFPIGQPTVSHHLRILTEAELVLARRDGQHSYFRLRRDVWRAYLRALRNDLRAGTGRRPAGEGAPTSRGS